MPVTPLPIGDTPPAPETELLADLDSRFTGDAAPPEGTAGLRGAEADAAATLPPERVDLLLRLHQLGAAWREGHGEPALEGPRRIDRFDIIREVGQGGFATVYEATDSLLGRTVALKVAHPEALVSPALRQRFLREAELASKVTHPNLVTIHDLGQVSGVAFIAEEFCSGGSLATWLDRHPGPVDPRLAALVVKHLAEALGVVHEAGIVHRDIKPENVLLVPSANGPLAVSPTDTGPSPGLDVKLSDFGLGKRDDADPPPLTHVTRAGALLGTPAWMAPEQVDPAIGPVGPTTDVHALGLILDRLLVGRCRWMGKTDSETMRLILLREPDAIDLVFTSAPRDLLAVCRKCLARNPAERYARAGDLAADLSRYLLGVPTRARPLSTWERACRFAIRRPTAVASVLALLLTALVAGVALRGWSVQSDVAKRQRDRLRRVDAAIHFQRGLDDLRAGNASGARERIAESEALDPSLHASFAGRWARRRLHGERQILFGDPDGAAVEDGRPRDLFCSAVSPDGRRIAVGAADGRLILLDAQGTSAPIVVPGAHDEINDVVFSPDGGTVASAGEDGRVRLFAAADGGPVADVAAETMPLFSVAFSPDGSRLAWAGAERVLCVADHDGTATKRLALPFTVDAGAEGSDVEALVFVDDETIVVAGGPEIMLVSIVDGRVIRHFAGHGGVVSGVDLAPDRSRIVSVGTDRIPRIWDVDSGALLAVLPLHPQWVQGCTFTADGSRIVTGCRDGVLQVFDASSGALLRRLTGHTGKTWDVRREPGGTVVSTGADGTLRRWTMGHAGEFTGGLEWAVGIHDVVNASPRVTVDAEDDPRRATLEVVMVRGVDDPVLVDATLGTARSHLAPMPHRTTAVGSAFDGPRGRLAIVRGDGAVVVSPLDGASGGVRFLGIGAYRAAWSPTGQLLTASQGDESVILGHDDALAESLDVDHVGQLCDTLAVAPDGSAVAAAGLSLLRVTPIARRGAPRPTGPTRSLEIDPLFGKVVTVAWAPDSRRLALGSGSGNVRILDVASGSTLHVLPGHRHAVAALTWSADGRVVISADTEVLRISDAVTAVSIDSVALGWTIRSVAVAGPPETPDRWLVVGGEAGEERMSADGMPGRGRLLVLDLGR